MSQFLEASEGGGYDELDLDWDEAFGAMPGGASELEGGFGFESGEEGEASSLLRDRLQDAPLAPDEPVAIEQGGSPERRRLASIYNRLGGLFSAVAGECGIPISLALAVWSVEGSARLPDGAWTAAGYGSRGEMEGAFRGDERAHVLGVFDFLSNHADPDRRIEAGDLLEMVRAHRFVDLSERVHGPRAALPFARRLENAAASARGIGIGRRGHFEPGEEPAPGGVERWGVVEPYPAAWGVPRSGWPPKKEPQPKPGPKAKSPGPRRPPPGFWTQPGKSRPGRAGGPAGAMPNRKTPGAAHARPGLKPPPHGFWTRPPTHPSAASRPPHARRPMHPTHAVHPMAHPHHAPAPRGRRPR